jgi:hypothetical protein
MKCENCNEREKLSDSTLCYKCYAESERERNQERIATTRQEASIKRVAARLIDDAERAYEERIAQ